MKTPQTVIVTTIDTARPDRDEGKVGSCTRIYG